MAKPTQGVVDIEELCMADDQTKVNDSGKNNSSIKVEEKVANGPLSILESTRSPATTFVTRPPPTRFRWLARKQSEFRSVCRNLVGPLRDGKPFEQTVVWALLGFILFVALVSLAAKFPKKWMHITFPLICFILMISLFTIFVVDMASERKSDASLGVTLPCLILRDNCTRRSHLQAEFGKYCLHCSAYYSDDDIALCILMVPEVEPRDCEIQRGCCCMSTTRDLYLDMLTKAPRRKPGSLLLRFFRGMTGLLKPASVEDIPSASWVGTMIVRLFVLASARRRLERTVYLAIARTSGPKMSLKTSYGRASATAIYLFLRHQSLFARRRLLLCFCRSSSLVRLSLDIYAEVLTVGNLDNSTRAMDDSSQALNPSLYLAIHDSDLGMLEALEKGYTRMILINANGVTGINLGLKYRQAIGSEPAYDYDLSISSVPSMQLVCDTSSTAFSSYPCHASLFIQIPTFDRKIVQQSKSLTWAVSQPNLAT